MNQNNNIPDKCLYSWGTQYDPDDPSGLYECQLERGHTGNHKDRDSEFSTDLPITDSELEDVLERVYFYACKHRMGGSEPQHFRTIRDAKEQVLAWHKAKLLAIKEKMPKPVDMESKYEGEPGGINTTIFDESDDPTGAKNGEMLAHLAQYASDQGYSQALTEVISVLDDALEGI